MKERKLKIQYSPGTELKDKIPRIVLQGKWLKELGFEVGEYVIITSMSFENSICIHIINPTNCK